MGRFGLVLVVWFGFWFWFGSSQAVVFWWSSKEQPVGESWFVCLVLRVLNVLRSRAPF